MGDWNAIVGETRDDKEVGEFGLANAMTEDKGWSNFAREDK